MDKVTETIGFGNGVGNKCGDDGGRMRKFGDYVRKVGKRGD